MREFKNLTGLRFGRLYGARGITVCAEWLSFDNFYLDMGDPPNKDSSIDRIDNNKGYSKTNCRWAARSQQQRNTRKTTFLEIDGQKVALSDLADSLGIKVETLRARIKKKKSLS